MISKSTGVKQEVVKCILTGLVEITKGCHTIGALEVDFIYKIIIINFIIAWGGFSIHSQSISFISETDISQIIYIFSKFFHGLLTIPYTYIIYKLLYKDLSIPSYNPPDKSIVYSYKIWMRNFKTSLKLAMLISVFFVLASILIYSLRKTKKEA